jgi:hypothetical protein
MAVTRTRASLAIQHDALAAHHVTDVLGIAPTESFEVGDAYARDMLTRDHSHWSLESPAPVDAPLEQQLRALLDVVAPTRAGLAMLAREDYRLTWTCFVEEDHGDGAVSLSSGLLAELGSLPVDLWFDSYADSEQPA